MERHELDVGHHATPANCHTVSTADTVSTSHKRRSRVLFAVTLAIVLIAAVVAVVFSKRSSTPSTFTTTGTFTLMGTPDTPSLDGDDSGNYLSNGQECAGTNGYDDITDTAQVTVADDKTTTTCVAATRPCT